MVFPCDSPQSTLHSCSLTPLRQREPTRFGPYEVIETLGDGGTGIVLRCVHGDTGDTFAVKVPKSGEARNSEALRREIGVLLRLSRTQIRGVVRILAHDADNALPWYAMELLEGRSLRLFRESLWADAAPRVSAAEVTAATLTVDVSEMTGVVRRSSVGAPEHHRFMQEALAREAFLAEPASSELPLVAAGQLERVLTVLLRIAEVLAQIHAEGVVHGDLTPSNVIFRDETDPVLIDFGTALLAPDSDVLRELPLSDPQNRGTPGYVAPELLVGEIHDGRSDLYALGCIMYELFTGQRPFQAGSQRDLFRQQLKLAPIAPAKLVRGLPTSLDEVVEELLERDPSRRLLRAEDVCRRLCEHTRKQPKIFRQHRRSSPLYRPRMHGRKEPLRQLLDCVDAMLACKGGLALVRAESGMGKTRLLNELQRQVPALSADVRWCRAVSSPLGHSERHAMRSGVLELFAPLLLGIAEDLERGEAWLSESALLPALSDLKALLPELFGKVLATESEPDAHEHVQRRALQGLCRVLIRMSERRGLLLLIDDLQWADEVSIAFLRQHTRELAQARVLIVANYRAEAAPGAPGGLEQVATSQLELGTLTHAEMRDMARELLGASQLPEGAFEFLRTRAEGNPFYIAEYTRAAVARNVLYRDREGTWAFDQDATKLIDTPASIDGLFELRLQELSEHARAGVRLASILGREFDTEAFRSIASEDVAPVEVLEELVAREVLAPTEAGRYRFSHDKLREAQERALSPSERAFYHRRAAELLEQGGSPWMGDRAAALGYHWAMAGQSRRALPHLERAALLASDSHLLERATELYRLTISQVELLPDEEFRSTRIGLEESLADLLFKRALHDEGRKRLQKALEGLGNTDRLVEARVLRKLAASFWTLHEYARAGETLRESEMALERVLPNARGVHYWTELIQIRLGTFQQLYFSGDGEELNRLMQSLGPLMENHGTPEQRCVYYFTAASHALLRTRYGRTDEAVSLAKRGLSAAETLPIHRRALGHFIVGSTLVFGSVDDCQKAKEHLELAHTKAKKVGEATLLSRIRTYQSLAMLRLGDVEATETCAQAALEAAEAALLTPYVAAAQACQGWVAWRRGEVLLAQRLLETASKTWNLHPHKFPFRNIAVFPQIDLAAAADDFERVRALLEELESGLPELPGELTGRVLAARTALERSSTRDALEAIQGVLQLARRLGFA